MIEFDSDIMDCVKKLREKFANRKHCVITAYPIIEILKYSTHNQREKEISTKLFYSPETESFEIQASDNRYYNRLSYFDYNHTERRWVRSMNHLFQLIGELKTCGLWQYISNKDFLVPNQHNIKVNKGKRKRILDIILLEDDDPSQENI